MNKTFLSYAAAMAAVAFGAASAPAAEVIVVQGTGDLYLAGQPNGTSCCSGDAAPDQSPTQIASGLVGGGTLNFAAVGGFNYGGGVPVASADGDNDGTNLTFSFNMTADNGTGIAGANGVNVDGLIGVFLSDDTPSGAAPTPLDYASLGLDAASYAPGLNQIFWIGDGFTGLGTGSVQNFIVPTGATRLFLGGVDGGGWYNNTGVSTVTITGNGLSAPVSSVPEPAGWALMIGGFALAGGALRHRTRRTLAVA